MSDFRDHSEESLEARLKELDVTLVNTKDSGERSSMHYEKGRIKKEIRIRNSN